MKSDLKTRTLTDGVPGEGEERFRTLFESVPIGIAVHSADGRLVETNQAYQRMLGYSAVDLRELGVRRVTHPEDVAEGRRLFEELRAGTRQNYHRTKRLIHKDGRVLWAQSTASSIRDESGQLRYIISAVEDTTERMKAERRERAFYDLGHRLSAAASEESAGRMIFGIADQLFSWDACYLHLYDGKDKILPVLTIDTVEGQRTEIPPSTIALVPSPMMRRVSAEGPLLILREHPDEAVDDVVPFGEKTRRSAALMYAPIHQGDKTIGVLSVQSYTPHAYDRKDLDTLQALADHCEAALDRIRICSDQVRLQREVLSISSHERQRIGKDLHDDLCQLLTGLGYLAQSLQTRLATAMKAPVPSCGQCAGAASTADHIVQLADQALSWTRKLSRELASEGLELGGLFPALTDLTATLEQLFRISCSVRWDPDIHFSDRILEEHLYRITQEAITNAVRHGKAGRITVDFRRNASTILLTIQDNGVGLAETAGASLGMGLRIMRYRARQIGADFDIQASPEGGTAVICRIPEAPESRAGVSPAPAAAQPVGDAPAALGGRDACPTSKPRGS